MIVESSRLVTPANGPRPAGKPTKCFYCQQPLGQPHKDDCVCFIKIVMVEVTLRIPRVVPAHWDKYAIEFHLNDSSWCAGNIVEDLKTVQEAKHNGFCLCSELTSQFIQDATEDDLQFYDISELTKGR